MNISRGERARVRQSIKACLLSLPLLLVVPATNTFAQGFDVGIGLALVGNADGLDAGWDAQLGYEFAEVGPFNVGAQLHLFSGWQSEGKRTTVEGMSFSSNAFYVTARPVSDTWGWLQLKLGAVNATYRASEFFESSNSVQIVSEGESEWGLGMGIGLVLPFSPTLRLHVIDIHHYRVGSESFTTFGLSLGLIHGRFR